MPKTIPLSKYGAYWGSFGLYLDAYAKKYLEILGALLAGKARANTPPHVDTGVLMQSWQFIPGTDGSHIMFVGSPVEYSCWVEHGHHSWAGAWILMRTTKGNHAAFSQKAALVAVRELKKA